MRISRSLQLHPDSATLHNFWKCHNKEFYLANDFIKILYLDCIKEVLKKPIYKENIEINAFCVLSNHYHQKAGYKQNSRIFSDFMREAHSLFGSKYNKLKKRSGKVAESRPKTSLIENSEHEMRVQFYIEANTIRAGIHNFENLKLYKYSSFGFYAYGIESQYTHMLTLPQWYIDLGETPRERQRMYRKLFKEYLDATKQSLTEKDLYKKLFIGSVTWVLAQNAAVQKQLKYKNSS